MRITGIEFKKLLNIKLIIVLIVFSVLYVTQIPYISMDWWNHTASKYDVDFYRELIVKFGSSVSPDEWDEFLKIKKDLADELTEYISKNEIMQKYSIDTFEEFENLREKVHSGEEHDTELGQEYLELVFHDLVSSPLCFKLQCMNDIIANQESGYIFSDDKSAEKKISEMETYNTMPAEARERIKELWTGQELSLLNDAVTENVKDDFIRMVILVIIWCFVLILPYQITEELKNIRQIQLTTYTGRIIFRHQALVCALAGLITGIMVSAVYAYLLWHKGAFDFINCSVNNMHNQYWVNMNYGAFLLLYASELIMTSVAASLLAYILGRISANYITGIGISIPAAVILCMLVNYVVKDLFIVRISKFISVFRICIPLVILPSAAMLLVIFILQRDKVRDIA